MKEASKLTNNKVVEVVVALSWELSARTVSLRACVCVCDSVSVGGARLEGRTVLSMYSMSRSIST